MTVPGKGGPPKGTRNAAGKRHGIPKGQFTQALYKASKRIDRERKANPLWGSDPHNLDKEFKGLNFVDRVALRVSLMAEAGDIKNLELWIERLEGKAVSRTETLTEIQGNVKHEGFQIEFVQPKDVTPPREVIEHEDSVS